MESFEEIIKINKSIEENIISLNEYDQNNIVEYDYEGSIEETLNQIERYHQIYTQSFKIGNKLIEKVKRMIEIIEKRNGAILDQHMKLIMHGKNHIKRIKNNELMNEKNPKRINEIKTIYNERKTEWGMREKEIEQQQLKHKMKDTEKREYDELISTVKQIKDCISTTQTTVNDIKRTTTSINNSVSSISNTVSQAVKNEITTVTRKIVNQDIKFDDITKKHDMITNWFTKHDAIQIDSEIIKWEKRVFMEIEKYTEKRVCEIIFSTDIHDWSKNTTEFNEMILNRRNILIMVETINDVILGQYIKARTNKTNKLFEDKTSRRGKPSKDDIEVASKVDGRIEDNESFVFSTFKNKFNKYFMQSSESIALTLYEKDSELLMMSGNRDIVLYKKEKYNYSFVQPHKNPNYDYRGEKDPLFYMNFVESKFYPHTFTVRKIQVFQLK